MLRHYIEKISPFTEHEDAAVSKFAKFLKDMLRRNARFLNKKDRLNYYTALNQYLPDLIASRTTFTDDLINLLKAIYDDTQIFIAYHAFTKAMKSAPTGEECSSPPYPIDNLNINKNKMLYIAACYNHVDIFKMLLEADGRLEVTDCFNYLYLINQEGYSGDGSNEIIILKLINDYFKKHPEEIQPMQVVTADNIVTIAGSIFTENLDGIAKLLLTNCNPTNLFFYFLSYIQYHQPTSEMKELFFSPDYLHINHYVDNLFYFLFPLFCKEENINSFYTHKDINENAVSDYMELAHRVIDHPSPVFKLSPECENYFFVQANSHQKTNLINKMVVKSQAFKNGLSKCSMFALGNRDKNSKIYNLPIEIIHLINQLLLVNIISEKVKNAVDSWGLGSQTHCSLLLTSGSLLLENITLLIKRIKTVDSYSTLSSSSEDFYNQDFRDEGVLIASTQISSGDEISSSDDEDVIYTGRRHSSP